MDNRHTASQLTVLVMLRILTGWHFLDHGVRNLSMPGQGSMYLLGPDSFLPAFFETVSARFAPHLIQILGPLNVGILILIGASLMLGLFARAGTAIGIMLLVACYFAGFSSMAGARFELVNTYALQIGTLLALFVFPTSRIIGLDYLIALWPKSTERKRACADVPV